jgi:hypothetical protein
MVVLGILTLLIVRSNNFYVCQSGFVVFALLEFLVATSIIAPLSRTKREFSSSTELPASIHDSISDK